MQKRKGQKNAPVLPVTQDDGAAQPQDGSRSAVGGGRRSKQSSHSFGRSDVYGVFKFLGAIVALGLLVVGVQRMVVKRRSGRDSSSKNNMFHYAPKDDRIPEQQLALAEFQSLQYSLGNSQLVALYFAASWCPMSTPVSKKIDEFLSDILLPPPPSGGSSSEALPQRHGLSLVYVSSDKTKEEFIEYMDNRPHWMAIPYDSPERSGLKKRFHTCAKIELSELEMTEADRQHEIPTMIIIDGESHHVLTYNGAKDIVELGAAAVDEWFGLSRVSQALDKKFDIEEASYSADSSESGDEGV